MLNIALFVSGRIIGFEKALYPFVNLLKKKYKIYVFFSINTNSLDADFDLNNISNNLKSLLGESFGDIHFEEYKMPKSYVENKINNNINNFQYNSLSSFYNDFKNIELIESFERNTNIIFDVICKIRSDIIDYPDYTFIVDDKDSLIIRNKHMCNLQYWGHIYKNTPLMISDTFAYGNLKSMKYYVETYNFILQNDLLMKGNYINAGEVYLTDNILQNVFYKIPGGGIKPTLSEEEIFYKYNNIPNGCKIHYITDFNYSLLPSHLRHKNSFTVNLDNVCNYS